MKHLLTILSLLILGLHLGNAQHEQKIVNFQLYKKIVYNPHPTDYSDTTQSFTDPNAVFNDTNVIYALEARVSFYDTITPLNLSLKLGTAEGLWDISDTLIAYDSLDMYTAPRGYEVAKIPLGHYAGPGDIFGQTHFNYSGQPAGLIRKLKNKYSQ